MNYRTIYCYCKQGILMSSHCVLHPKHWRHGFGCSIIIASTFKLASNRCYDCGFSMCVKASNGIKGSSCITNKCKLCLKIKIQRYQIIPMIDVLAAPSKKPMTKCYSGISSK